MVQKQEIMRKEVMNMVVSPSLHDVRQIAASGSYDVLPVSAQILSDFTTPI